MLNLEKLICLKVFQRLCCFFVILIIFLNYFLEVIFSDDHFCYFSTNPNQLRSHSQQKPPDDETTPTNTPLASHKTIELNGGYGMASLQNTVEESTLRRKPSQKSGFFSNFKTSNTSLSKNSRKSFSGRPLKDQLEDSDVMMGHRRDHDSSIQSLSRHSLLESPLRPGSVKYEASQDLKRAALSPNDYATLGRSGHRSFNPLRSSFMGTSYSHAGRLHDTSLPSPPPPPPIFNESHISNLAKSKKSLAPPPPRVSSMKSTLQAQHSLPIAQQYQSQQISPKTAPPLRPPPFSKSPIPPQRNSMQLKQQSPPALQHSPQQFVEQNFSQQQQVQHSIYSVPHQQKTQPQQAQQINAQQQQQQNKINQQHFQQQTQQQQQPQNPQQSLLPEQQIQLQKLNQEIHSHVTNQQTPFPVSPTPKTSSFKLNQQQKSLHQQTLQTTQQNVVQQNIQEQDYTSQQQQQIASPQLPSLQQLPSQHHRPQKSTSPQPISPRSTSPQSTSPKATTSQPKLVITQQNPGTTTQFQQPYPQQQQTQQQQQQQDQQPQRPKYVPYSIKNNVIITDLPAHTTFQNTSRNDVRTSFHDVTSLQRKSFILSNNNNNRLPGNDEDNNNNNNNNINNVKNKNNSDDDNDVPIRILKKYDEGLTMKC